MEDFEDDLSTHFRPRFEPSGPPVASFVVSAVGGPDVGGRWMIDETAAARILVGTGPACGVRLRDREVSRRHLALEVEDTRVRVLDLDSTNGTWLGPVKIREVWLSGGEQIQLGSTQLRFERGPRPDEPLGDESELGSLVGGSREMRRLYGYVRNFAANEVPVLIEGETGTGKELVAESIHLLGPRKDAPFVVLDCAAVPAAVAEVELFGQEATGDLVQRSGVLEQANGGTLLLDEVADLDAHAQQKLSLALERKEIRRVGGTQAIPIDVRVLAATRRDLDREVQAGRLRDDLYHRFAVARVELPPLRKRRGDVPRLVELFCRELGADPSRLSAKLVESWEDQPWPGNVRELRTVVARAVVMGETAAETEAAADVDVLDPRGDWLGSILARKLPLTAAREKVLRIFEARYVAAMLEAYDGNVARAATAAGVARRYFQILNARRRA